MPSNPELTARVRTAVKSRKGITEKRMFGGDAFLLHGNLLVAVWGDSLIVRLGLVQAEEVQHDPEVGPMDLTGRRMKGWIIVAPSGVETDRDVKAWVQRAIEFVKTLVPK
jgi:TfoX/Sxy family transcriptional regulator of competence genes